MVKYEKSFGFEAIVWEYLILNFLQGISLFSHFKIHYLLQELLKVKLGVSTWRI